MRLAPACLAIYLLLLLLVRGAAAAETCPEPTDDDTGARRTLAREWFARAEEAEAAGDRQAAVRRYSCSLKLVPHPSTAYNLGTAAEKSGDVSMAIDAFKVYLNLAPDAADRATIEARLARLEAKLAELRQQLELKPDANPAGPGGASASSQSGGGGAPPPPVTTTKPAPRPAPPRRSRLGGWIAVGGATAAVGTGVALNLLARSKMHDCYARAAAGDPKALDLCDTARPFAYGSYGLFALAGVLGVTGAAILFWNPDQDTRVSFVPTPGGGALFALRRF